MRMLVLLALVTGCAGVLSDQEAQNVHAQNETAQSRALANRGLTELPGAELADGATLLGDPAPVEFLHPRLGETVVSVPRTDRVFAVDGQGVVHEVAIAIKYVRTARENVHHCDGASGGTQMGDPAVAEQPATPPPPRRYYVRLAAGQTLGPPTKVTVERVDLQPVYVTGRACREIP